MKAKIYGIEVEGSPREIVEFQRMQEERAQYKPHLDCSPYSDGFGYEPGNLNMAAQRDLDPTE